MVHRIIPDLWEVAQLTVVLRQLGLGVRIQRNLERHPAIKGLVGVPLRNHLLRPILEHDTRVCADQLAPNNVIS